MREILSWVWGHLINNGAVSAALDFLRKAIPGISRNDAEKIVSDTQYAISVASLLNADTGLTIRNADKKGYFSQGFMINVGVELGRANPNFFDVDYIGSDVEVSIDAILEDIRQGVNFYDLPPSLVLRIIKYPDSARLYIKELWQQGAFQRFFQ